MRQYRVGAHNGLGGWLANRQRSIAPKRASSRWSQRVKYQGNPNHVGSVPGRTVKPLARVYIGYFHANGIEVGMLAEPQINRTISRIGKGI
jgi:hypothetical protein